MVTSPVLTRVRRRLTSLIKINALPHTPNQQPPPSAFGMITNNKWRWRVWTIALAGELAARADDLGLGSMFQDSDSDSG